MIERLRKLLHLCPWGKYCWGEGASGCVYHGCTTANNWSPGYGCRYHRRGWNRG